MPRKLDLTNQRFGMLTCLESTDKRSPCGRIIWRCICDCGNICYKDSGNIKNGNTTSCGCYGKEQRRRANTVHGMKHTKVYNSWALLRDRCNNPNNHEYKNYGGRGIKVCDRWNEFKNFYDDMGNVPAGYSIERIDVNGDYESSNCVWASLDDQSKNKTNNRYISYDGKSMTLKDWSRELGISYWTLHARLRRGWTTEEILNTPVNTNKVMS